MLRLMRSLQVLTALILVCAVPSPAFASVFVSFGLGVSVNFGPPALPVYAQPPCPAPNMIWNPGYWAWGSYGYFWVPGTWIAAPRPGLLWTPGYWAYNGGSYGWHAGYWAPHVGFYGGINYGYGYFGSGFVGGGWHGNAFAYNTAVTNVNTTIVRNVYVNKTVVNNYYNTTINRVSYNGGPNGVRAIPTEHERFVEHERHLDPTPMQRQHIETAQRDRTMLASYNSGRPIEAAVARPYSAEHPPQHFAPVRPEDRANAQTHVATAPAERSLNPEREQPAPGFAKTQSGPSRTSTQANPAVQNAAFKTHNDPAYQASEPRGSFPGSTENRTPSYASVPGHTENRTPSYASVPGTTENRTPAYASAPGSAENRTPSYAPGYRTPKAAAPNRPAYQPESVPVDRAPAYRTPSTSAYRANSAPAYRTNNAPAYRAPSAAAYRAPRAEPRPAPAVHAGAPAPRSSAPAGAGHREGRG
jgi:hypothetical protein